MSTIDEMVLQAVREQEQKDKILFEIFEKLTKIANFTEQFKKQN